MRTKIRERRGRGEGEEDKRRGGQEERRRGGEEERGKESREDHRSRPSSVQGGRASIASFPAAPSPKRPTSYY